MSWSIKSLLLVVVVYVIFFVVNESSRMKAFMPPLINDAPGIVKSTNAYEDTPDPLDQQRGIEDNIKDNIKDNIEDIEVDTNNDNDNDKNLNLSPSIALAPSRSDQQRPWIVVHVGPPKTATTTIQIGLNQEATTLASADNIFYVGSTYHKAKTQYVRYDDNNNNNNNSNKTKGVLSIHPMKTVSHPNWDPKKRFIRVLKYHQQQKHNVVISAEFYTSHIPKNTNITSIFFDNIYDHVFLREGGLADNLTALSPMEQRSIAIKKTRRRRLKESNMAAVPTADESEHASEDASEDESSRFGFDVKIVVGYRHYFQWLPSYYYQEHLVNRKGKDNSTLIDYIENTLGTIGDEYFVEYESEHATNRVWSKIPPPWLNKNHGTLFPYLTWSSQPSLRKKVDIFDMHQQHIVVSNNKNETLEDETSPDLFRDFVCQSLPTALETCSGLQQHAGDKKPVVANVRSKSTSDLVSSLETGMLSDTLLTQMVLSAKNRLSEHPKPIQIKMKFSKWTRERNEKMSSSSYDDGHRQLCLGKKSTRALRTASWNMLRHIEALVRMRDDDRTQEAENQTKQQQQPLFVAPEISRPKHPLLLSPNKYNHGGLPNARNDKNQNNEDWWAPIKRAHDELFEETVAKGAYCELDLDRLFADHDFVKQVFYS